MRKFRSTTLLLLSFLIGLQIQAQVTADFVADTTNGCGSASVQFTDLSTGNITSWTWTFGNSNTSTLQNPSAAYTIVGTYDVTLTVSDGTNSDTKTITDYISVFRIPTADFTLTPTTGCSPLPVDFTNTSTQGSGVITTYLWDFSDGSQPNSTENPTHTYQTGGTFPPSLQITDVNGCSDIKVFNDVIVTAAPIADFTTLNPAQTCADTLTVHFLNSSTGGSLSYEWDFGDGQTSTQANPVHFYNGLGTYDVTLIVSDPNCSDTLFLEDFVRLERTNAQFSFPSDSVCFGVPIDFINESTGADLFRWDFGDRTSSTAEDPTKTYQDSGFFVVKLTVSAGPICLNTFQDTIYVQQVIADFKVIPEFSCNPREEVAFVNQSTNADSAFWRIQDDFKNESDSIYTSVPPDSLFYIQFFKFADRPSYYNDTLVVYSEKGCSDTLIKDTSRTVELIRGSIISDPPKNIVVVDTPLIPFSSRGIIGGCAPLDVTFRDSITSPRQIVSWEWDFGIDTSNLKTPPLQTYVDDTIRTVTLTVTNNLGCTFSSSTQVGAGFKQNPKLLIEPDSACPGENNFIYEVSTDSLKVNYWELELFGIYNNERIRRINDTIMTDTSVVKGSRLVWFSDTGSYEIIHKISHNGCDTIDSTRTILYVYGPISRTNTTLNDCTDRQTVQFFGNFIDVTRFKWDFGDGSPIDSVNENPVHTYSDSIVFYPSLIIYNDNNRCGPIYDTTIIDLRPLVFLRILPPQREFCTSDSINLRTNASMRYEEFNWIINGDTVGRKKEYPFDTVPGTYYVELRAKDYLGCTYTALDTFYITQLEVDFDTLLLSNCFPYDIQFNESSISDTTIVDWFWRFGKNDSSIQKTTTFKYSSMDSLDVFLRVENVIGCKDSILKKNFLYFEQLNVRFLNGNTNVCIGDSITFRNVSSGLNPNYIWDFGDGDSLVSSAEFVGHRYKSSGQFTVSLTGEDATGCIKSDTKANLVQVDPAPTPGFTADTLEAECYPFAVNFQDTSMGNISQWEWKFGDATSSVFENPFHNYTSVGNFDVSLKVTSPNGCTDSITKVAYIKTKGPTAEFVFDKDTICINEEVTFNIIQSSNVGSFFWDFGDGNGGQGNPINHTYTQKTGMVTVALIVSDSSGNCTVPLEDSLFVYDVIADFSISDDSVCVPYEAQFTKQSIGDDSFRWNFGSGNFSTVENPTFNYSQAGIYQVSLEINSNIGCNDTAFKEIEVFPIPMAVVGNDTGLCVGNSILLVGSGGISYQWTPTNTLSTPFNDSTIATPDSTTTYRLIVGNEADCKDTTEIEVFVQQAINYSDIPDSSIIIGEQINLNAFAGLGFNYKWTPDIGLSCNDCENPIAQPLANQTYILEIFDDFGCFYLSDTIKIEVIEKFSLDVPTAFSPNGDGSNDIIYVKGWGLKELIAFKIYNRFGELVFESTDFDIGWDGTYRGQDQNIETYIFTVEALTFSGKVLTKKGNISLLR